MGHRRGKNSCVVSAAGRNFQVKGLGKGLHSECCVLSKRQKEQWTGDFSKILRDSPMGDLTFGPYDVYIKTLMEVFPDELIDKPDLGDRVNDILYSFQNRNAGILINKLNFILFINYGILIDYSIKHGIY